MKWIVFYNRLGRELAAYTQKGMFDGELESTLGLLAYEHGMPVEDITFAELERTEKP